MKTRVLAVGLITLMAVAGGLAVFTGNLSSMFGSRSADDSSLSGSPVSRAEDAKKNSAKKTRAATTAEGMETATFGSGCFWCTEAVFQRIKGVESVVSGFSGGNVKNPTYYEVCEGMTGHAEVVQVTYDPKVVTYPELLEVFWKLHDPTTLNRQGNDVGTQYRSVIFYHTDEHKELAEHYMRKLDESGAYSRPIVTEIAPYSEFYPAEDYHQNYFRENGRMPYCQLVIVPKMEKLKEVFRDKLK
jgi:peptide-methionine (S)-S-oxide reductase